MLTLTDLEDLAPEHVEEEQAPTIGHFPKIWHLGHRNVLGLQDQYVEVTEKVDGSQFVVGKNNFGKLQMRSKGAMIDQDNPPNLFAPVVEHFLAIQHKLVPGIVYYGETLCKPKHNTLPHVLRQRATSM